MLKRKAIVCDVDGVLLQTDFILREIFELGLKGEDKWDYFYEHCNSDRVTLMSGIKDMLGEMYWDTPIIISTARNEKCRAETVAKLAKHKIFFDHMYMRACDDLRSACEVKREHLLKIMEEFDIVAFIDDDLENCEMAKELGILALRRV